MKRALLALLLLSSVLATPVCAEEPKPDDKVILDLSAENWVTTKTARVTLAVEAAVSGANAGTMRASMTKTLTDLVKTEWRLTSFNRSQDQTGMERWSAFYEARIAENELNGLADSAKKASKPGMQITVASVDFSPTLDETQAVINGLRTQLYKQANEQLTALNAAIQGRSYRIALIDFSGDSASPTPPRVMNARPMMAKMAMGTMNEMAADSAAFQPMEKSEKLTVTARVVLAAVPPAGAK